MPTVDENRNEWNQVYNWEQMGDEWSSVWGGADTQWHNTLLPRIHRYVPAATILEIAPGFGRWTQFLKDLCKHLVLVDMSEKCIRACQDRFNSCSHIEYHLNDGRSLDFIADESVDFVFSFDSLVHVEGDVIEAYLNQLARKLKKDGVGFIHHSNLGEYQLYYSILKKIPKGKRWLIQLGLLDPIHLPWRAPSMTASKFRVYADKADLLCLSQELVNWNCRRLIDCISVFAKPASSWKGPGRTIRNPDFMNEARHAFMLSQLYGMGRAVEGNE